jgi:nucleoid-associated protein YgaU
MEEGLKKMLKALKFNESTISMVMGLIVVVVISGLVINYFRNKSVSLPVLTDEEIISVDEATSEEFAETPADKLPPFEGELPTEYKVREGDNLWTIAERYYQTGYGWVEIADVNELSNANLLEKGQRLIIPQLSKAYPLTLKLAEAAIGGGEATVADEVGQVEMLAQNEESGKDSTDSGEGSVSVYGSRISGERYIVEKGDHLWGIADRAYGDPYKWVKIAEVNNLENPSLIYVGNELTLPR